ncbi:uncharacterized protein A1O9_10979 [Exophiala aquamarina CBS 119918]|uniref:Extracellular membrane protein CFEM domain-containing protein n=1 Tax=Exophiala aquamarina CBS 119918 TaxID=1182545 RepID=A0A072NZM7_9EURO|nr:uncharacterized protein A1O9_10979 [Exophiala aquamarina CBS 119918]KEF53071.1 hypothetical protein A1O9_10979 [Exophiala aquamarina CBS 119918]
MGSKSSSSWALACLLFIFVQDSTATFRFSDIQLVVGFSSTCTSSYQSSISNCNLNDLAGIGGSGSCSSNCQSSIRSAQSAVQRACSRETADLNSLIGKIFVGEAVEFLCDPVIETSTTTTTVGSAETTAALTNTATAAATQTTAATSTAASSNSQSASPSTDSTTATSETSSSSASTDSTTFSITSFSTISTSTTSASAASTTTTRSNTSGGNAGGGGSPFDPAGNTATFSKAIQPHFFVLTLILIFLVSL